MSFTISFFYYSVWRVCWLSSPHCMCLIVVLISQREDPFLCKKYLRLPLFPWIRVRLTFEVPPVPGTVITNDDTRVMGLVLTPCFTNSFIVLFKCSEVGHKGCLLISQRLFEIVDFLVETVNSFSHLEKLWSFNTSNSKSQSINVVL